MPLLAVLAPDAFDGLPDETVIGKDSYVKDEKENVFKLNLNGEEAGKLAKPLQEKLKLLETNNAKLLDEKIKTNAKVVAFEKLGKSAEEIDAILKAGKTETIEELEKKYAAKEESLKTASQAEIASAKEEMEKAKNEANEVRQQLKGEMKSTIVAKLKNKFDMNSLGDDFLSNRIDVVLDEETGKYTTRVMVNGEPAYKAGQLMTPEQLAEDARANRELTGMFNGGTAGGSGAQNNHSGVSRPGTVLASDQAAMSASLEDIAAGKVKVAS